MADFLHQEFDTRGGDVIEVELDRAANVQLLDNINFDNYKNGREFRYYGGYVTRSPFRIAPPNSGHWHLVIDLGGAPGVVLRALYRLNPYEQKDAKYDKQQDYPRRFLLDYEQRHGEDEAEVVRTKWELSTGEIEEIEDLLGKGSLTEVQASSGSSPSWFSSRKLSAVMETI